MYSSYELQEWGRMLRHPMVRPGGELELLYLSAIGVTHLSRKIFQLECSDLNIDLRKHMKQMIILTVSGVVATVYKFHILGNVTT